jgi:hypothetical protein
VGWQYVGVGERFVAQRRCLFEGIGCGCGSCEACNSSVHVYIINSSSSTSGFESRLELIDVGRSVRCCPQLVLVLKVKGVAYTAAKFG